MKVSEAEKLVCPLMSNFVVTLDGRSELLTQNCICEECMFWVTTMKGKKEIDRKIEPYDMTPYNIAGWAERLKNDGYVNIGRCDGFRNNYAKYEETNEGYCQKMKEI